MAELEDLVLKRFRVERINGQMVATEDPAGVYRSGSKIEVEKALSTEEETDVDVLMHNKWHQIRGTRVSAGSPRVKKSKEYRQGYNAGYSLCFQRSNK